MRNTFRDQGNMERNFLEHGNSVKVNFREHLNLFLRSKGTTVNFHREQGNTHLPWVALYALIIKKRHPISDVVVKKRHKHSIRTDTIECYDHYTIAYWKSMSLVNLKTIYLGISKVT